MPTPPNLLNDDGTASMATCLMMSHHAFRRDLRRFLAALEKPGPTPVSDEALREAWQGLCATLHGHHEAEDHGVFPGVLAQNAALAPVIEGLSADHRRIDPLLERGSLAFAGLPATQTSVLAVVRELHALLDPHLAIEEAELIPFLRDAKAFPSPQADSEAEMYAKGFAWAMHGIAPEVIERVHVILPEALLSRLPSARTAFEAGYERTWGKLPVGAARTPIPDA